MVLLLIVSVNQVTSPFFVLWNNSSFMLISLSGGLGVGYSVVLKRLLIIASTCILTQPKPKFFGEAIASSPSSLPFSPTFSSPQFFCVCIRTILCVHSTNSYLCGGCCWFRGILCIVIANSNFCGGYHWLIIHYLSIFYCSSCLSLSAISPPFSL